MSDPLRHSLRHSFSLSLRLGLWYRVARVREACQCHCYAEGEHVHHLELEIRVSLLHTLWQETSVLNIDDLPYFKLFAFTHSFSEIEAINLMKRSMNYYCRLPSSVKSTSPFFHMPIHTDSPLLASSSRPSRRDQWQSRPICIGATRYAGHLVYLFPLLTGLEISAVE